MGTDGVDVRLVVPSPAASAIGPTTPVTAHPSSPPSWSSSLPRTGVDVLALVLLAVALVVAGVLLVTRTPRGTS